MKKNEINILSFYLLLCFALSGVLFLISQLNADYDKFISLLINLLPGIVVIALYQFKLRKAFYKGNELGFQLKGFRYWILAPALVTILCLLAFGVGAIIQPDLIKNKEDITLALNENGIFSGNIGVGLFATMLINTFLGSLVIIPLFLGLEIGWRAFMQTRLLKITNSTLAFIVGGSIWGLWSFLFTESFIDISNSSVVNCILTIMLCIPAGAALHYFYIKSQSIFVAALAHAALYKSFETAGLVFWIDKMNVVGILSIGFLLIAVFLAAMLLTMKKHKN